MKRQLTFDYENEHYVIKEDNNTLFSINGRELKFVSLDFYTGIYKDRSAAIELTNVITTDELKKGKYIFDWLTDIISAIQASLNDPDIEEQSIIQFAGKQSKKVYLFEMAACAGDGFYSEGTSRSDDEIISPHEQADYAVRISGKSMEPTLQDNSIVFVQRADALNDGEIGIFVVDGNVMCKRFKDDGGQRWLQPDNDADEYSPIMLTEETVCYCQGRVLFT